MNDDKRMEGDESDFDSLNIGVAARVMVGLQENPYEEAERLRNQARNDVIERLREKENAITRAMEVKVAFESGKKRPAEGIETLDPLRLGNGVLRNTGPFIRKRLTLTKVLENYVMAAGYKDLAFGQWIYNVDKKLQRIGVASIQQFVVMAPQINSMLKAEGYKELNHMTMEKILKLCVTALHHYEIDGLKKLHFTFKRVE